MIQLLEYEHQQETLEAYIARPKPAGKKLPAVLLMHAWGGRDEFVEKTAEYYANKGYIGVALDNFGKGVLGTTTEEKSKLITPFMQDRKFLAARLKAGIDAIQKLDDIDHQKMVVMGYCFGGLCALDLLRNSAKLSGFISVHGLLGAPDYACHYHANAKVLALTGYNDPMVTPEQTRLFGEEMNSAKVDWQLITYGNTQHAFTNPAAHDKQLGLMYNALAAKRSTIAIDHFIAECFA